MAGDDGRRRFHGVAHFVLHATLRDVVYYWKFSIKEHQ